MGRLYQLMYVQVLLTSWFVLAGCNLCAEDFCSLTVRVVSPDGRRPEAPISVREQDGRVVEKDQEPGGGDVKFCDLGILPVAVTVGSNGLCNQVTVRDVPVSMDRPYLLRVTYDPEACDIWHKIPAPVPQCELLFRVADSEGKWLAGVPIKISKPTTKQLTTDRYGRAGYFPNMHDSVSGKISVEGFRPTDFTFTCSDKWKEYPIRLEKP